MISLLLTGLVAVFITLVIWVIITKWEFLSHEVAILVGASVASSSLLTVVVYLITTSLMLNFNEVWHFKIIAVRNYEAWNERVSCSHPIYEEEEHEDSEGNTYTTREVVGHKHAYDVDDHSPYWVSVDEQDKERHINNDEYERWKIQWNNTHIVEMNRDYHTIDGDMNESNWTGEFNDIYPFDEIHTYENRIRVSRSVFDFGKADSKLIKQYPRPADDNDTLALHGIGLAVGHEDMPDQMYFRRINALYGKQYQVHVLVYLVDTNTYGHDIVEDIRSAWQGPNKNELVTFIGLKGDDIIWSDVMSWSDDTTIHSLIRQDIVDIKRYSYKGVGDILLARIPDYWQRKSFKDFEYIAVELPVYIYIIVFILSVGASVGLGFLLPNNQHV